MNISGLKKKISGKKEYISHDKKYRNKAKEYIEKPDKLNELYKKSRRKAKKEKGSLEGIWDSLMLIFELVRDWKDGRYKDISKNSLIMIIVTLLYFVMPVDTILDYIPVLGLVDDAAVIGFTLKQINKDIEKYKQWKYGQKE